ncbi:MAG: TMEM14 family protein [Geitlerinemataceae cyanobacterium]
MNGAIIAAIAYGVLAIVGGTIGYRQAKSQASLISGVVSGILLVLGGIVQLWGQTWGLWLSAIVTTILIVIFAIRLIKTRKFMPAGLMLISGTIALVMMLAQVFSRFGI